MKTTSQMLSGALLACLSVSGVSCLPQVNLGYEIHEALSYNVTSDLYYFKNIRFAQPPTGNLRFKAPVAPVPPADGVLQVERGEQPRFCPQGTPSWGLSSAEFGDRWYDGTLADFNYTAAREAEQPLFKLVSDGLQQIPGVSEDCLFLDVIVPKKVFENKSLKKAAVFVWLPGGGYVYGSKDYFAVSGDPSGLIAASQRDGSDGIIFVSPNYRLGAFGWLAGPDVQAAGGTPNAGLHDQVLAFKWVKDNIHLFGGDKTRVTAGGLSAGGGSLLHHLTAYGGHKGAPLFQRAFLNSPGYLPIPDPEVSRNITKTFLSFLGADSVAHARNFSSAQLMRANADHILSSTVDFVYGPAVDGDYVPALPDKLLRTGQFHKDLDVLLSHQTYEGGNYGAPYVETNSQFDTYLRAIQPSMTAEERHQVISRYGGSSDPTRTIFFSGDFVFACQTDYVARAYPLRSHLYEFNITRPFHGTDLAWTFAGSAANPPSYGSPLVQPQSRQLQEYITNFVKRGDPNGPGVPLFPTYDALLLGPSSNFIRSTGIATGRPTHRSEKCRYFQDKLYVRPL